MSLSCSGLSRSAREQLRDDLVAAPVHAEAVDEVAAHRRREVLPDGLEVQPQLGHLVAVDHDLRLGLVDLDVDERREGEHAALRRLLLELLGEAQDLGGVGGGGDARTRPGSCRRPAAPAAGWGRSGCPGWPPTFCCTSGRIWTAVRFRSFQGLSPTPQKPPDGKVIWKVKPGLRDRHHRPVHLPGRVGHLVEGRVGRGVDDAEDDALVLDRRQLLGRLEEHGGGQQRDHRPGGVDDAAGLERGLEVAGVGGLDPLEGPVDEARRAPRPRARP